MLGDVVAETLTTQFGRDIYDVVDRLITQVVIMVDGTYFLKLCVFFFFKRSIFVRYPILNQFFQNCFRH